MSEAVELRPGLTPLADWRAIYRGAPVILDPVARADVEAGRAALSEVLSRGGLPTQRNAADASPSVADLVEKRGEPLPNGLLRLFVALKLGSLAQGMSGVRWSVVESIEQFLARDLLPVVGAESVDDRTALARLFAALTATGEVLRKSRVRPAHKGLKKSGLAPLKLDAPERAALLSGTQLSSAAALAGLFEAERVFQSAIVAAALSAAKHPEAALHQSAHRLHRQRGQIEVAAAFGSLLGRSAVEEATASEEPHRLCPIKLGACLDMLRYAGASLERAARAVSEDHLVLWQSKEIVAGTDDLSSVALASDLIALSLRTIGDLSEARISASATRGKSSEIAANENTRGLEARAAVFVAENRERARPTGLDISGVWRLLPMAGTTALVVAIEFLEATRATEGTVENVPIALRPVVKDINDVARPPAEAGAAAASNLASIGALVGSGALAAAPGLPLPSLTPPHRKGSRCG